MDVVRHDDVSPDNPMARSFPCHFEQAMDVVLGENPFLLVSAHGHEDDDRRCGRFVWMQVNGSLARCGGARHDHGKKVFGESHSGERNEGIKKLLCKSHAFQRRRKCEENYSWVSEAEGTDPADVSP